MTGGAQPGHTRGRRWRNAVVRRPDCCGRTALSAHAVDAIVIGGLGGYLHGIPVTRTYDADPWVSREPGNIDRLVGALGELGAVLRDPHSGLAVSDVPVGPDLFGPGAQTVIFATEHGPVDVVFRLDGTEGFDDLTRDAVTIVYAGVAVRVASARDIVRSKAAANRAKPAHIARL